MTIKIKLPNLSVVSIPIDTTPAPIVIDDDPIALTVGDPPTPKQTETKSPPETETVKPTRAVLVKRMARRVQRRVKEIAINEIRNNGRNAEKKLLPWTIARLQSIYKFAKRRGEYSVLRDAFKYLVKAKVLTETDPPTFYTSGELIRGRRADVAYKIGRELLTEKEENAAVQYFYNHKKEREEQAAQIRRMFNLTGQKYARAETENDVGQDDQEDTPPPALLL